MERSQAVQKIAEMIKGIRIAMLTTVDSDGALRSRPMATQEAPFDGDLWFFTLAGSSKSHEIERDERVNVSYADTGKEHYVSLSGRASVVRDRKKTEELWSPLHKAWFPKGVDDPELALIKIDVEKAEYWDAPSSTMVQLVGLAKALATGERYTPGENEKVNL